MALAPRTRLGPYEIVEPLGAGGMGEVYRARDSRLGRDVAVKILPALVASDPEWRARLEREARAISALSHPNICHLYDIGHHEGTDFLVMECLDGETLAQRLASRGALPPDLVLRHGVEIANALHAAHRKGIVHRDLKPGNIMLTRTGARLLDFGLAKPALPDALSGGTALATVTSPLTARGAIVGTFQYMSPEQAEGREADARSDIFALGAVLYEMATGKRAFEGASPASVIAAILERDPPPVSSLQPLAPAAFDDLVRGCLGKDPDERWQTAHDVRLQLQAIARQSASPTSAQAAAPRSGWMLALLVLAALVAIAAGVAGRLTAPSPASAPSVRATLLPPPAHSFSTHDFAISPDGRRLAFVATAADGVSTLWVQSLDAIEPSQISGSAGASAPVWSPDSRSIAFFTRNRLMRVEPGATGAEPIAEVLLPTRPGAWGPDGTILFNRAVFGGLYRVPEKGGTAVPATDVPSDQAGEAHRFPQFLADGRRFLYVASWTNQQRGGVYLSSLDGGEPRLVSADIRSRILLVNDELYFARDGVVYAQAFDHSRGELSGSPRPVIRSEVGTDNSRFGDLALTISTNGILVYQSVANYTTRLVWYERSGKELEPVGPPNMWSPALSPDSRRVGAALDHSGSGRQDIWVHDMDRGITTQVTREGVDSGPAWSPDGRYVAYSSLRATNGVFRRPADGTGDEELLVQSTAHLLVNHYSRDGTVLYMDFSEGVPKLRAYNPASGGSGDFEEGAEASYSPDGKWMAYVRYRAGMLVVTRAGDPTAPRVQVSALPGSQLRWRGDSKEIFFVTPDKKLMAVSLTDRDGTPELGSPVPLFQTRIVQSRLVLFQYDVTPDGQRFLINSLPREDSAAPLTVLTNWTAERP